MATQMNDFLQQCETEKEESQSKEEQFERKFNELAKMAKEMNKEALMIAKVEDNVLLGATRFNSLAFADVVYSALNEAPELKKVLSIVINEQR